MDTTNGRAIIDPIKEFFVIDGDDTEYQRLKRAFALIVYKCDGDLNKVAAHSDFAKLFAFNAAPFRFYALQQWTKDFEVQQYLSQFTPEDTLPTRSEAIKRLWDRADYYYKIGDTKGDAIFTKMAMEYQFGASDGGGCRNAVQINVAGSVTDWESGLLRAQEKAINAGRLVLQDIENG